jgi:hypothetical protein
MLFNHLKFHKKVVKGKGRDTVGLFEIKGTYDKATLKTKFEKQYVGKHTVIYEGVFT